MSDSYAVVVPTDGDIKIIALEDDDLAMYYREIGCTTVEVVTLDALPLGVADGLHMWVDEDGQFVPEPRLNPRATGVALAARRGRFLTLYVGVAVFTGGADEEGETLGLTWADAEVIKRIAIASGEQVKAYLRDKN